MKKRGFPRQSISNASDEGQITLCVSLFFLLFFSILLVSQLQLEMMRASGTYVEDALAASGLACALIDLREYGSTHVIRIADERTAYESYCRSLRVNLGLDDHWECANQRLIAGPVTIENYTIYNVSGEEVEICRLDNGKEERSRGERGKTYAPNGQLIERTGIYGEISYPFKGLFGMTVTARKGKLVEIAGKDEEK